MPVATRPTKNEPVASNRACCEPMLRPAPARIVDALLHERESDAIWELPVTGLDQSLWVHVLAEVQSGPDVDIVLRALDVQVRLWERQRRLGVPLTAVIPLVISHGADWRSPRTMLERLKLPPDLEPLVAPYIPTSTYLLEDLARFLPEALAARFDLSASLRVAYFILQRSRAAPALVGQRPRSKTSSSSSSATSALSRRNLGSATTSRAPRATLTKPPTVTWMRCTPCSAPASTPPWRPKWERSQNNSFNVACSSAGPKVSGRAWSRASRRALRRASRRVC